MSKKTAHEKCHSSKFKRMNYFHGMLLTEQDFKDEQTYIREKLKLHNRLHGTGVVWGLDLKKCPVKVGSNESEKDDSDRADSNKADFKEVTKIFITGGLALDCAGNEIVVCEKYLVPLDEKIAELRRSGRLTNVTTKKCEGPKLFIGIRYCECKSDPAEQYTSECADDRLRPQFSRVREGFSVEVFTADELPGCAKEGDGEAKNGCSHTCSECEGLHPCTEEEQVIILGSVENYLKESGEIDYGMATVTTFDFPLRESPYFKDSLWEAQRRDMLRTVFGEADWIDVSGLIGKKEAEIEKRLEEKGLTRGETYKAGDIKNMKEFVERATYAQHWAAPKSKVDIVTDNSGNCILFVFVNPPPAAGAAE